MNIETYSEPGVASVNSYLVDVGEGVVVIDCQRSLSSARKLLAKVQQRSKPVLGIFITHPHPDHIGGLPVLVQAYPRTPVYALQITRDTIESDAQGYSALSKQVLGDDFDQNLPIPNHLVSPGDTLTIGNLRFHVEDAGPGEAACMMMLYLPSEDTVFCADVVQHEMTAFLLESRSAAWLQQIDKVAADHGGVRNVYPGHGKAGPATELLAYQTRYLESFRRLITQSTAADGSLSVEGKKSVVAAMKRLYPGYLPVAAIPDLLEQDVDAVQKEMRNPA